MGNDQCCAAKAEVRRELVDNLDRYALTQDLKDSLDRSEWEVYNSVQLSRSGIILLRRPISNITYLIQLTFKEHNIGLKPNLQYSSGVQNVEEDIKNGLELIFSNETLKNFFIERIDDTQKDYSTAGNRKFISQQYLSRRLDINEQEYQSRLSYHLPMNARLSHQQNGDNSNNYNSGSPHQNQNNQGTSNDPVNPFNANLSGLFEDQNNYIDDLMPMQTPHLPSEQIRNGQNNKESQRRDIQIIEQLTGRVLADPKSSQRIANDIIQSKEIVSSIKDIQLHQPQILSQNAEGQSAQNGQNQQNRRSSYDNNLRSTGTFIHHQIGKNQNSDANQQFDQKKSERGQSKEAQQQGSQRFENNNLKQSIILNSNRVSQNIKENNQNNNQQNDKVSNVSIFNNNNNSNSNNNIFNNKNNNNINNNKSNHYNEIESLFGTFNNQEDVNVLIHQSQQIPHNLSQTHTANFNSQQQPMSSNRMQIQSIFQQQQQIDQGLSFNINNYNHNLFQTPEKHKMTQSIVSNQQGLNQTPFATVNINSSPIQQNKNIFKSTQQLQNPQHFMNSSGQQQLNNNYSPNKQQNEIQSFSPNQNYQSLHNSFSNNQGEQKQFPLMDQIKAERDSVNHYFDYRNSEKHSNPYEPNKVSGDYVTQFQYKQYQLQNSQISNSISINQNQNISNNSSIFSPNKNKQQYQQHINQQNQYQILVQPPQNSQVQNRGPILIQNQEEPNQQSKEFDRSQYFKRSKSPSVANSENQIVSSSRFVYNQQVKIQ